MLSLFVSRPCGTSQVSATNLSDGNYLSRRTTKGGVHYKATQESAMRKYSVAIVCFGIIAMIGVVAKYPPSSVKAQSTYLVQTGTNSSSCAIGGNFGSQCFITVPWPTAFTDNNYSVACSPTSVDVVGSDNANSKMSYDIVVPSISPYRTTTSTQVILRTLIGNSTPAPQLTSIQCIAVHL